MNAILERDLQRNGEAAPIDLVLGLVDVLNVQVRNREILQEAARYANEGKSIVVFSNHTSHLDSFVILRRLLADVDPLKIGVVVSHRFYENYYEAYIDSLPGYTDEQKTLLKKQLAFHKSQLVDMREVLFAYQQQTGFSLYPVIQPEFLAKDELGKKNREILTIQTGLLEKFQVQFTQQLATPSSVTLIFPEGGRQRNGMVNPKEIFSSVHLPAERASELYLLPLSIAGTQTVFDTTFDGEKIQYPIDITVHPLISFKAAQKEAELTRVPLMEGIFRTIAEPLPIELRGVYTTLFNAKDAAGGGEF
jgi:hypothetical protein